MQAVTAKGATPASNSVADICTAIDSIEINSGDSVRYKTYSGSNSSGTSFTITADVTPIKAWLCNATLTGYSTLDTGWSRLKCSCTINGKKVTAKVTGESCNPSAISGTILVLY